MKSQANDYLSCVLKSHQPELEEARMNRLRDYQNLVRKELEGHYKGKILKIVYSGSYAKHTGINTHFDMDLCVYFRNRAFTNEREMYNSLRSFLQNTFVEQRRPPASMRPQRRSINLKWSHELDLDVVPVLSLASQELLSAPDGTLWDNENLCAVRTNVFKHIDFIKGRKDMTTDKRREIIRLLKVWKSRQEHITMKSFLVELLVIEGFNKNSDLYHQSLVGRLNGICRFIAQELPQIRLLDPANASNVVSDTLTLEDKKWISAKLKCIADDLEQGRVHHLRAQFPLNEKFRNRC